MSSSILHHTDVVVVGAGPVGLFFIFQAGMMNMSCHVVDPQPQIGGQCSALYPEKPIYDIPAYPQISGGELIDQLAEQADPFKPTYHLSQQVTGLERQEDGTWKVTTSKGIMITAKAVVIAAGCGAFGPKRPPLAGLANFEDTSVFYHVRNPQALKGKRVVIAGGGDSAIDWTINLAPIAEKVMLVHRRPKFRAAPNSVSQLEALQKEGKVELVTPFQLDALEGEAGQISAVIVKNLDNETKRLDADILLPFFGLAMELGPILNWGLDIHKQHILVNPATMKTNLDGIYGIGDIIHYPGKLKLILTGFSEAACAAHTIYPRIHPNQAYHFEYSTTKGVPCT